MSLQPRTTRITAEDYLRGEQASPIKHEFVMGQVYAMAGASEAHNTIALNAAAILKGHAKGGQCRVLLLDMKVRVDAADAYYYPDVLVTCDPTDNDAYAKRRPKLIVEVLSPTTEALDRGAKFADYRRLDSLEEYLLIASDRRNVECFRREADGRWVLYVFNDEVQLSSVGLRCTVDALYEGATLDSGASESPRS